MKEFITFDTQNNRFIPLMPEAYNFTQKMNNPEDPWQREMMYHMKKDCNIILEGIMTYVKEELEKKVRPGVKVMGRESGEITKLHCLVYGFYPRAVDVKWMKKRTDEVPTYQTTHVLPNPDGTYQIRVSAEVIPQEGDRYSCYVDHSSLEEPLLVDWEPRNSTRTHVLIVVLVGLLIVSIIAGVVIYKKRKTISTWTSNHTVRCLELLR
ncbi:hypothetical protein GDO78_016737 [Eleutherodactylus coqui]|uniref:Ig-like domain-containing protein n=2 Tax=Eleutherodactylus coqui TaxID=57060 RepID=A0A8J6BR96_ELECQ|nr:hypothetical protein GDO78_016737 [Eleutherodactylus coqui]